MASKAAYKRLSKEYVNMQKEPPPFVWAAPDEKNILTWNFIIQGPPDSPYVGGEYHGILIFPSEYPFKPPGIKMFTPSGRFQPDKKICFSMSDFHPGSWNPAWSVATILTGLLSFMLSDEMTTGSVTSSDSDKRAYAARSHAWNLQQRRFKESFPDYCTPTVQELPNMGEKDRGKPATPDVKTTETTSAVPAAKVSSSRRTANTLASDLSSTGSNIASFAVPPARATVPSGTIASTGPHAGDRGTATGWTGAWRQLVWEKWRWGLLIALAVIVSRVTTNN